MAKLHAAVALVILLVAGLGSQSCVAWAHTSSSSSGQAVASSHKAGSSSTEGPAYQTMATHHHWLPTNAQGTRQFRHGPSWRLLQATLRRFMLCAMCSLLLSAPACNCSSPPHDVASRAAGTAPRCKLYGSAVAQLQAEGFRT
jgi:hypothetical protein